jgi:hypothetical protein
MALVSADTSAEIKNITLDSFEKRHFAKPPARYMPPRGQHSANLLESNNKRENLTVHMINDFVKNECNNSIRKSSKSIA